jgi:hypothetical protein
MAIDPSVFSMVLEFNGVRHRVYKRGDRFVAKDFEYGFDPSHDATRAMLPSAHERRLMRYISSWDLTGDFVAYESEVSVDAAS